MQAPALPAFEARRSAAAAAAAAAAAGSWGHKYLPLTDAPTNMSSLQRGSKSYFTVKEMRLINPAPRIRRTQASARR